MRRHCYKYHRQFGFGCRYYNRLGYRKALRQAKRYGFDESEIWNIDNTFWGFLYQTNILGDKREIIRKFLYGKYDDELYDELRNAPEENNREILKRHKEKMNSLISEIMNGLHMMSDNNKRRTKNFLIPRLEMFREKTMSYPAEGFTYEKWIELIGIMIDEVKKDNYTTFMNNIFNMWY